MIKDLRDVIEQAKWLLLSKNDGQVLQEFIWAVTNGAKQNKDLFKKDGEENKEPAADPEKEAAATDADKEEGKEQKSSEQILEGLKTLGNLIITNGEFRKLLNDATVLLRDMASDVSQEAANKVRPSAEQLAEVDKPAPDNEKVEAPDFSKLKSKFKKADKSKVIILLVSCHCCETS